MSKSRGREQIDVTTTTSSATSSQLETQKPPQGHVGLVVLTSIAAGLALGLLLVLGVFAGEDEPHIVGSALVALGAGFILLAAGSSRFTSEPQTALAPGVSSIAVGLAVVVLAPGARLFDLSAWTWPVLLGTLVIWSFRGARRSLRTWSRRALVYPALLMLLVIAICGAAGAVMAAASSAPIPASGHTYIANGHRLYLNCTGTGSPTVVLFHGFGEWTPNRAWVQANVSHTTRACAFDRNVKAGAALMRPPKTAISSRPTCTPFFASRTFPGRMSLPATACARCRTRVQLLATPANRQP